MSRSKTHRVQSSVFILSATRSEPFRLLGESTRREADNSPVGFFPRTSAFGTQGTVQGRRAEFLLLGTKRTSLSALLGLPMTLADITGVLDPELAPDSKISDSWLNASGSA